MSSSKSSRKLQPNPGNIFHSDKSIDRMGTTRFAHEISRALRKEFGSSHEAVRFISQITSANERAVRNWLQERNGPSGESLVMLCRHSDEVMDTFLLFARRDNVYGMRKFKEYREKLRMLLIEMDCFEMIDP